jgi:phosphopantothenoylcysteine decarboxylase/phosphopantothenate--cysteine ligase
MKFLIVSGPTQEPLDPVRFLSNYSTGAMGKHLVTAAKKRGHRVTWVRCPQDAQTALALGKKLKKLAPRHDVVIMAAAVCDVRPAFFSSSKIKKEGFEQIHLVKNPDILATLSKKKKKGQIFIGFALESNHILKNGFEKLKSKNLDFVVVQKVTKHQAPFGEKAIEAFVLDKNRDFTGFKLVSKPKLARFLIWQAQKLKNRDGA